MSCKRLDITEFHCRKGRHLKKYTVIDCTIDLPTFLVTLPFITLLYMIWSVLQSWFLQMPTKIAVFYGKEK